MIPRAAWVRFGNVNCGFRYVLFGAPACILNPHNKWGNVLHTIRYNAARGSVGVICNKTGLVEAAYSGPLSVKAFDALREDMMGTTDHAPCSVIRLDKALLLTDSLPKVPDHHIDVPPAALIVRRDQYEVFEDYARKLAKQGVLRVVLLDSYAHLAYEWAVRQCPGSPA